MKHHVVTDQEHPNPFVESVANTYRHLFKEIYRPLLDQLSDVSKEADKIRDKGISIEDAVDLGFLCREIEKLFDESRKEVKARHERIARRIATLLVNKLLEDPESVEDDDVLVRGLYASGTPDVGVAPSVPRKGTQGYMDLCEHFGIGPELAKQGLVVWHYPQLAEYCTKLASEGKPIPPGIDGNATKITTIFRRLRIPRGKT